jgi:hypothetical protein
MPGVNVTTGVRVGPTGVDAAPASTFFIVGTAERGPVGEAKTVTSLSQFEAIYGGFSSSFTLNDNVRTYFEEGGTRAVVARVVGATAATATATVVDASAGILLTLNAASPGVWANSAASPLKDGLKVITVASGATGFTLSITYKGETIFSGGPFLNEVSVDGSTKYAKQFAAEAINASANLKHFVVATVGASNLNATAETTLFASGTEGSSVVAADYVTGLTLFDYDFGPGAVAVPGQAGSTIWDALRDHAVANRRIALCATTSARTSSEAIGDADDYWGGTSATRTQGSYMAFYWPWVTVPDGFGGSRDQSPEAFAAAARARAHLQGGPWRPGAGEVSTSRYVTGLKVPVTKATGDTLDASRVNALRVIGNTVRVYGARSVSSDEINWRFITYRDTLNFITGRAEAALEPLVFRPIDGRGNLFGEIEAILTGIMEPIRADGGVYEGIDPVTGNQLDSGYSVNADSANNPTANLANGVVTAVIGARVSPVADEINITITKSALNAIV